MSRFPRYKSIGILIALTLITSFAGTMFMSSAAHAQAASPKGASATTTKSNFCAGLNKKYWGSSGAQMYCFGSQPNGPASGSTNAKVGSFGSNVDAANPNEDVSPSGVRLYGDSETSIAAVGPYVVEAWNDATAFGSNCGAPLYKEEATGYGFSANGGRSFTDEGGLPNANCNNARYGGDPSVEAWSPGGTAYFYVSSLYNPVFSFTGPPPADARSYIAMDACKATGTGSSALISCSQPIIIASSSQCITQNGFTFCSFLDKDFLSIDPVRGRLYASFTEFGLTGGTTEELAVCDIGTATGGTGALGGTAGTPVCENGSRGTQTAPAPPYFVVAPADTTNFCENEGSYPAVDVKTGDVYVAFEHNDAALFGGPCASLPVQEVVNYVPSSCLALAATSSCAGPAKVNAVSITSMQAAFIPGYNRFPMNDFPRIAVSDRYGTVSIVWNDARYHIAGDILLQSFNLASLSGVQTTPVRMNSSTGGWHMLPALRNADANGNLNVSFYGRASATTSVTDVYAALNVNPRTASMPGNTRVTTASSDWSQVSSDIVPNFGDYTDNYVIATSSGSYTGTTLYVAWSDGRTGTPQPFEAHT